MGASGRAGKRRNRRSRVCCAAAALSAASPAAAMVSAAAIAKLASKMWRLNSCAAGMYSPLAVCSPPIAVLRKKLRTAKAGVWEGSPARPSEYRALKWEEAKRNAPDGCPIKGSVRGNRRYYTVPWARDYERVKVSRNRGERWFCSSPKRRKPASSRRINRKRRQKRKARAPGEERGLRCVTPLRGDRWEGATFGPPSNTTAGPFARNYGADSSNS